MEIELPGIHGIGSDMELASPDLLVDNAALPWEYDDFPVTYVETGRQALALVVDNLSRLAIAHAFLPSFLCETMVAPFKSAGFLTSFYETDMTGAPRSPTSVPSVPINGTFAVLIASYFGTSHTPAHHELARQARKQGGLVMIDETHHPFNPSTMHAAFYIASLRKTLPVADGAYIRSQTPIHSHVTKLPSRTTGRWQAMAQKAIAIADGLPAEDYKAMFARANVLYEESNRIYAASKCTRSAIAHLDYLQLKTRRMHNADVLANELSDAPSIEVLNWPGRDIVPTHLVVGLSRRSRPIQARLASRGIYAPIHWPKVRSSPQARNWPAHQLSLPVDHRYGDLHMRYIARELKEAIA